MGQVKRQVNDILDMWCVGRSIASIATATGLPVETVEYVINEYGDDVV